MREQERYWSYVREGRPFDYHGVAVHRRHLSMWEVYVLKRHLAYDPELDRAAKIRDLRGEYIAYKAQSVNEKLSDDEEQEVAMSSSASSYFESKQFCGTCNQSFD